MDNASIHRGVRIKELCEDAGVDLFFLPPYSPDLNPIEATFHDLKAWIRRNQQLAGTYDDFGEFIKLAVRMAGGNNARSHFRSAGYRFRASST